MKKALIAVAAVVLVIVIVALIAPFVIDLNQYKGAILSRVRPAVNRDVDFERVELTVLTGIGAELQGVRIPENPEFGRDDFLTLDSLQVRLKLLPLLKGEVQISELVFKKPVVKLRRNAQGVFNFQDMTRPAEVPAKKEKPEKPAETEQPSALAVFGVDELTVRDASVLYEDEMTAGSDGKTASGPKSLTVTRLDVSIENISLFKDVSFDARGSLFDEPDRNFRITGHVGPLGSEIDLKKTPLNVAISTDSLPLKQLTESLGLPVQTLSGTMNADISAAGSLDRNMDASTKIRVENLVLQSPGDPQAGPKKTGAITVRLDGKALYTAKGETVTLEPTSLEVNGNRLIASGSAQNVLTRPEWKMSIKSASLDPAALIGLLPMYAGNMPADLSFKGPARFDVRSEGYREDFSVEAGVDASLMEIVYGDLFGKPEGMPCTLEAAAGIRQGMVDVRSLNLALYNLLLSGSGQVDLSKPVPTADLRFSTRPMTLQGWDTVVPLLAEYNLDGSIGAVNADISGPLNQAAMSLKTAAERISFTLPPKEAEGKPQAPQKGSLNNVSIDARGSTGADGTRGEGTLSIGSGNVAGIALSDVSSNFTYAGGRLNVPRFSVSVFRGVISGSASYLTQSKDWTFNPVFKGVDAGQAIDTLTSFQNMFEGTLSGTFSLRGNAAKQGLESLIAQGDVDIRKGVINNVDLAQAVAEGFSALEGLGGLLDTGQEGVQRNRQTSFDSLKARFNMARQTLDLESFELTNIRTGKDTDSIAHLKGTVGVDTKALDLEGDITLSQRHSARLIDRTPVLEALADSKKRVVIPLTITGNMTKPNVALKTGEINKAVADFYARKGIEKGMEKLKERLGIPKGSEGGSGSEKIIEDLFNNIFKK